MNEATYWIALAHLPRWGHLKINNLIIKFHHEYKISIEEFFNLSVKEWEAAYDLDAKQILDLKQAKIELPSNAFLAESFFSQGYELLPIISPEYSKILKENLKVSHSPSVLYIKGNKKILEEKSVAIVGSRDASEVSLQFADNIAKLASKEYKVVVSGFAKGVDKQALDSAIAYKGQSIIVLPQGIMTFGSGFQKYYSQIINGDVLVLSTFFPKAPWRAELAMARNPIIYGLANEIYVAESSEKGGTWSGVIDGIRKNRKIYVRTPGENERNANILLIQKGAIPVDFNGVEDAKTRTELESKNVSELNIIAESVDEVKEKIINVVKGTPLTAKEILVKSNLDWTTAKLISFLKKLNEVAVVKKGNTNQYILKGTAINQPTLF